MKVTTWTLEMRSPDQLTSGREMPEGVRVERVEQLTPEFARFLYAVVGGPWRWNDRLMWSRRQWEDDLAVPGTETWVAWRGGSPAGYVQLQPLVVDGSSEVEIRYFGLVEQAIGHGIGSALLTLGIRRAWALPADHGLPPTSRVWLHTCDLDGPAALTNYRKRGLQLVDTTVTDEDYPPQPYGAWSSSGGPDLPRLPVHNVIRELVENVQDTDELARDHRADALAWLDSTNDIWRRSKPRTPQPHLVSYLLLLDPAAGTVLLGAHRLSGLWLPPGGHVEFGEDPRDTAVREGREELGIELAGRIEPPTLVTVTDTRADLATRHTDVSLWFPVEASRDEPLTPDEREFAEVRWWSAEEIRAADPEQFDPHLLRWLATVDL